MLENLRIFRSDKQNEWRRVNGEVELLMSSAIRRLGVAPFLEKQLLEKQLTTGEN